MKKEFTRLTILLIPIAIAINLVMGNIVNALKLPVFMDMIGTFIVSMLVGPWIGLVTGLLTNLLLAITQPTFLPFAVVSGALGVVCGLLAQRRLMNSMVKVVVSGLIISAIAVTVSILISVAVFGGFSGSGSSNLIAGMIAAGMPFWPAQFIGSFISEIPDKIISVIFAYVVIKNMSNRYKNKFPLGSLYM